MIKEPGAERGTKTQIRQWKNSLSIQEESVNESQGTSNKKNSKFIYETGPKRLSVDNAEENSHTK